VLQEFSVTEDKSHVISSGLPLRNDAAIAKVPPFFGSLCHGPFDSVRPRPREATVSRFKLQKSLHLGDSWAEQTPTPNTRSRMSEATPSVGSNASPSSIPNKL